MAILNIVRVTKHTNKHTPHTTHNNIYTKVYFYKSGLPPTSYFFMFQVFVPGDNCLNVNNSGTALDDLNLYSVPVGMS